MEYTFSRSMTDVASVDMVVLVMSEELMHALQFCCTFKSSN